MHVLGPSPLIKVAILYMDILGSSPLMKVAILYMDVLGQSPLIDESSYSFPDPISSLYQLEQSSLMESNPYPRSRENQS